MRSFSFPIAAFLTACVSVTGVQAQTAHAQAATPRYSTATTPLSKLLSDPAAKAIIEAHIPGMTKQHGLMFVKGKSLKTIQGMSKGGITDEQLAAIDADFANIR
ncbi:hypothetical protein [Sphingomonas sp. NFX23]|uniref:hypothetical protein n=1 Tax=Sphingomonas sp. NFX23 TaxID=2819532 RepID=UPI003CFB1C5B